MPRSRLAAAGPQVSATVLPNAPGQARRRWLRRYGLASLGGVVILVWCLIALLAPLVAPHDPSLVNVTIRLKPPSQAHWLGTDQFGRPLPIVAGRPVVGLF